jgi:hypothetical protein
MTQHVPPYDSHDNIRGRLEDVEEPRVAKVGTVSGRSVAKEIFLYVSVCYIGQVNTSGAETQFPSIIFVLIDTDVIRIRLVIYKSSSNSSALQGHRCDGGNRYRSCV